MISLGFGESMRITKLTHNNGEFSISIECRIWPDLGHIWQKPTGQLHGLDHYDSSWQHNTHNAIRKGAESVSLHPATFSTPYWSAHRHCTWRYPQDLLFMQPQRGYKKHLEKFYNRLCIRGYKRSTLEPIFSKGISTQAKNTIQDTLPLSNLERNRVFLHLPYNPGNPSSSVLQHIWHSTIAKPRGRRRLEECKNKDNIPMELNRMTVAYSRCLNIGNLLSYRKLPDSGPPASSYWLEATCGPSHTHAEDQALQLEQEEEI